MTDYRHLRIDLEPCTETATDLLAAFLAMPVMNLLYLMTQVSLRT